MKNYGCWRGQEVYIRRIKIWTKGFWVNSSFSVDTPHLFLHCWRKIHWQQLRKTVKKEKLNEKTHRKHPIFRISPFRIWNAPSLHYGVHTTIFGAKYVGMGVWKAHNIFQLSWLRYECSNTIILKCMGGFMAAENDLPLWFDNYAAVTVLNLQLLPKRALDVICTLPFIDLTLAVKPNDAVTFGRSFSSTCLKSSQMPLLHGFGPLVLLCSDVQLH